MKCPNYLCVDRIYEEVGYKKVGHQFLYRISTCILFSNSSVLKHYIHELLDNFAVNCTIVLPCIMQTKKVIKLIWVGFDLKPRE